MQKFLFTGVLHHLMFLELCHLEASEKLYPTGGLYFLPDAHLQLKLHRRPAIQLEANSRLEDRPCCWPTMAKQSLHLFQFLLIKDCQEGQQPGGQLPTVPTNLSEKVFENWN
jgi:hypothetical protein